MEGGKFVSAKISIVGMGRFRQQGEQGRAQQLKKTLGSGKIGQAKAFLVLE